MEVSITAPYKVGNSGDFFGRGQAPPPPIGGRPPTFYSRCSPVAALAAGWNANRIKWMEPEQAAASVDPDDEVRRFFARLAGGGRARGPWRRCTSSIRCGLAISATGPPSISAAIRRGSTAFRACGCSISAAAAAFCRSRWRGSARASSAPIRRRSNIAVAPNTMPRSGPRDRLSRTGGGGAGAVGRNLRHRACHGSDRACRRCRPVCRARGGDGEAGRVDVRRYAQPHHEKLCARDRRRRIYFALAAARHPSMGQVRHARTSSKSRSSKAACTSPTRPA